MVPAGLSDAARPLHWMVAGLNVSSGTIRIGGGVVNDVEAKDRNISMVFQSYALSAHDRM
jgi:ABC-type sugar transport system ATPase subunit